jgi:hypothetical protein
MMLYQCLWWIEINILTDEQLDSNMARFDPQFSNPAPSEALADRCEPANGPTEEEYHVLVRKGPSKTSLGKKYKHILALVNSFCICIILSIISEMWW